MLRDIVELAWPLGTPLGLAQLKRASSRVEAGTSGFLSNSDSDRSVPAELGQESQATSYLRNGTPLAFRVVQGVSGPLSNCVESAGFSRRCTGVSVTLRFVSSSTGLPSKSVRASGSYEERTGIGVVQHLAPPTWLVSNFLMKLASS